jgi:hypothetical protein
VSVFLYAVRCNFAGGAAREAAWHDWYNGPKLRQMLALPLFLAVQRFAATALDTRRKYLALWQVASPDAFTTPEYRAQWGFADWTDEITDWSRDLYRGPDDAAGQIEIGPDDALHVASFDGASEMGAREQLLRIRARLPGTVWLEAIGLDRHAPLLGLRKLPPGSRPAPLDAAGGLRETIFAPLTPRLRPPAS